MKKFNKAALVVMGLALLSFCSACQHFEKYPHDNFVEESVEKIAETMIEERFNLPKGSMHGRIDFTPFSPE